MSKRFFLVAASLFLLFSGLHAIGSPRETDDFNFGWQFHLGEIKDANAAANDSDIDWQAIRLPHDWSIIESYQQENTGASTGFLPGGIGWYQKSFLLPESDRGKTIWVEFDGVYCKSEVWINGQRLGFRPSGYSSFSYDLTEFLNFGQKANVMTVKVDHSAYLDSRWYTGSGIYRNVRLVKTSPVHIPQWGVQVTTPNVDAVSADVQVRASVVGPDGDNAELQISIIDSDGTVVATKVANESDGQFESTIAVSMPDLWSVDTPNLYIARTTVKLNGSVVDETETKFGIRSFNFDANKGFSLNGESMKIKGVNLHHDAGAVGAAVPKAIWEDRVRKLKSIGGNAIRMSHNPHSVELMDVCDEMGMLVIDEFFDEWHIPKDKSIVYVGDNKAKGLDIARGYSEYFDEWAQRDLKDLIRRDFNHPSVIIWSIGNEIEWTFPKYSQAFKILNPDAVAHETPPVFDPEKVKPVIDQLTGGNDPLASTAMQLSAWVKEMDTSRPVTCGSVRPAIAAASGYADAVDILGFNYRAECYDIAHQTYPDLKIIGSENWGAYSEWKSVKDRDFVSGMFAWTGFAYLGEAGPWPRKGLNLAFFDFAGSKTPRGHFFECLWKDEPKVYMVTTPAAESEYSYSDSTGWSFEMQMLPPPLWGDLRRWEWYRVNEHWAYEDGEDIVVQVYTNCDQAELFLDGNSLGRQALADFPDDHVIKWLVPYDRGKLVVKGFNDGKAVEEFSLETPGTPARIELACDNEILIADRYDVVRVTVQLQDKLGRPITNLETPVTFQLSGPAELLAVDNGSENNIQSHYQSTVGTNNGRASALIRAGDEVGTCKLTVSAGSNLSNTLKLKIVSP
ncbi:Beta-galactosidase [Rubripirellula obstinata]|uniref:Beta-galactosidase n=1 Tax=Rubripirellula obstinata TaxID=406547 RepID=A0A5B1CJ37_9BACT|nr:sugar-binding domain-containing protein [Rubripirellula obstinata]KAA1261108.1 Beta-galactosidase [Rubripirellula obstinata]